MLMTPAPNIRWAQGEGRPWTVIVVEAGGFLPLPTVYGVPARRCQSVIDAHAADFGPSDVTLYGCDNPAEAYRLRSRLDAA